MRVIHVVKTSDGATWAAEQAAELVKLGVEVHVALPCLGGRTAPMWAASRAILHAAPVDLPVGRPWALPAVMRQFRDLVSRVRPDIIHSHFFGSTVLIRLALGASHPISRLFQVPGPLHLEHRLWRGLELSTAGPRDRWIASSRCIQARYRDAGVQGQHVYLSYYGFRPESCRRQRTGALRERLGIAPDARIVGNANLMYPPKWYLGQRIGLKAHEDVIDALRLASQRDHRVTGVLIGGQWGGGRRYEAALRARARRTGVRILMPGLMSHEDVRQFWPDFDCAVHVPLSENCGGVVEPLAAGVPVVAGQVGGLPEVVMNGLTGVTVPVRSPADLADGILAALEDPVRHRAMAEAGRRLVATMFDVRRTASEIFRIYRHLLHGGAAPSGFDSRDFLQPSAEVSAQSTWQSESPTF